MVEDLDIVKSYARKLSRMGVYGFVVCIVLAAATWYVGAVFPKTPTSGGATALADLSLLCFGICFASIVISRFIEKLQLIRRR